MKKIPYKLVCVVTILITVIFLFSGCDSEAPVSSSDSRDISSYDTVSSMVIEDNTTSGNTKEPNFETGYNMPCDIQGEIINGFEKDAVVYLNESLWDNRLKDCIYNQDIPSFVTIAHIHNGRYTLGDSWQSITEEETKQYIATANRIFTDTDNTYNIFLKDYYDETSTGYSQDSSTILLRTNADWDVTPWKVKYINYDIDKDIEINQKWIDELSSVLDKETGGTDTPVIIRESWSFDYNGKTISFINASNVWTVSEDGPVSNYKFLTNKKYEYNDTDIIYMLHAAVLDGKVISYGFNLGVYFINKLTVEFSDKEKEIYYTFHREENGDIVAVPFYRFASLSTKEMCTMQSEFLPNISFIGDLDNDGSLDIIYSHTGALTRGYSHSIYTMNLDYIKGHGIYSYGTAYSTKYPLFYYVSNN